MNMYGFLFLLFQSNHSHTLSYPNPFTLKPSHAHTRKPANSKPRIPDPVTQNSYLRTQLIPYICINKSIYQNEIFY